MSGAPLRSGGWGRECWAGSRGECQEAHCAAGKWDWGQESRVRGQGSDLQHVRQGRVQHNQVREKGAKVRDRAWGQVLWPQSSGYSQPALTLSRTTPFCEDSACPPSQAASLTGDRLPGRVSSSWGLSAASSWGEGRTEGPVVSLTLFSGNVPHDPPPTCFAFSNHRLVVKAKPREN